MSNDEFIDPGLAEAWAEHEAGSEARHPNVCKKMIEQGASLGDLPVAGSLVLRGVAVALDTEVGQAFILDCGRHTEGLLSDSDIKAKWELSDEVWTGLAKNAPLLQAVRTERDRRIVSGDAAREAAQRHFAKAPTVLGEILRDELVSPRHRIEAAKELRQVAGNGPQNQPNPGEKFIITIDLGGDDRLVYEKKLGIRPPSSSDDGEMP